MDISRRNSDGAVECPRCRVRCASREVEIFGPNIRVDDCPKCRGVWLDKGEMSKLVKDRKMVDFLTKDIGNESKSKLVCPRCGGLMDLQRADEIEVDVCLSCGGVWLDAKELGSLKAKKGFVGNAKAKEIEKWKDSEPALYRLFASIGTFRRR